MTIMYIGDLNQYRVIREMFDTYSSDISSEDCFKTFEEYWNRRIDSPQMCYVPKLQLTFSSEEEQTFWLLKNA